MNIVVLIGRLVRDPELKFLTTGTAVANFTVAVDKKLSRDKKKEFEAQGKPTADFIRVVVWNKAAESCAQYLSKGRLVGVKGSISTGTYKKADGSTVFTTDVLADDVQFLEWGDKSEKSNVKVETGIDEDFRAIDDEDVPF